MNRIIDWLCYQAVIRLPLWRLDPRGRIYGDVILPRAGNHAYRDQ